MTARLRVTEIFYSLQGEASTSGRPTIFIRLTGCPLRCVYCDTAYAFQGGESLSLADILDQIAGFPSQYVTVTGGEPLAQPQCLGLLNALVAKGYFVSLETSGALSIEGVDPLVSFVLDLKTPGSGEAHRNLEDNIPKLKFEDQVKFVITDRVDYEWSRFKIDTLQLNARVGEVLFSPVYEMLQPSLLADWILADGLNVRMQVQLHKLLWGDKPGV
jgi:7-carboxy-7-deazaguanine synthase